MISSPDKKRKLSSEQQDSERDGHKLRRTTRCNDENDLAKWMARNNAKTERTTHRLKRQSALVGKAFVSYWDRNTRPQVAIPSLGRKIESFSINFETGENNVTFVNER